MNGLKVFTAAPIVAVVLALSAIAPGESPMPGYDALRADFQAPDHAEWGEVPLWWWEGQRMTKERCTEELEELAAKGVKAVCPIQRSPARCDPPSFSPEWWELFAHVAKECDRLDMQLWAYDQVGYGNYGWLEKAAAEVQDPATRRVVVVQAEGAAGAPIRLELPAGDRIAIRAYPLGGWCCGRRTERGAGAAAHRHDPRMDAGIRHVARGCGARRAIHVLLPQRRRVGPLHRAILRKDRADAGEGGHGQELRPVSSRTSIPRRRGTSTRKNWRGTSRRASATRSAARSPRCTSTSAR